MVNTTVWGTGHHAEYWVLKGKMPWALSAEGPQARALLVTMNRNENECAPFMSICLALKMTLKWSMKKNPSVFTCFRFTLIQWRGSPHLLETYLVPIKLLKYFA